MTTTLSPLDREYLVRTIYGEANGEPLEGMAAVAHTVMNRTKAGRYGGSSVQDVVLSPSQFEPWSTRRDELLNLSPNNPAYRKAAAVADAVLAGQVVDPTNGATHFLNADIVRQRRGGSLPSWAQGDGQVIGRHTFLAPEGRVSAQSMKDSTMVEPQPTAGPWQKYKSRNATTPAGPWTKYAKSGAAGGNGRQDANLSELSGMTQRFNASDEDIASAQREKTVAGAGTTWLENFTSGIPIVGPALQTAGDYIGTEAYGRLSGQDPSQMRQEIWQRREERALDYPMSATSGQIGGALAATGAAGATKTGANLLGITGNALIPRLVAGGGSNALIAGVDTVARGGSVDDATQNALYAGGLGAGIPMAGRGLNALADMSRKYFAPRVNALLNPTREAELHCHARPRTCRLSGWCRCAARCGGVLRARGG